MPTPPALLPASACWEIRDDASDAAADPVQMNNPDTDGVPWTSAVAAMSQRSEAEAFLEGAPSAGSGLTESEPLSCRLSWLGTEPLRVRRSPRSWQGDDLLPGFCSCFCMQWELGGGGTKAHYFSSQARNQANALTWANETPEYHGNVERGLFHPRLLTFPMHFNQRAGAIRGACLANSKVCRPDPARRRGFPQKCWVPAAVSRQVWTAVAQGHLTPEEYFNPTLDLTTYPGEGKSWAGRTYPIAVRALCYSSPTQMGRENQSCKYLLVLIKNRAGCLK